MTLKRDPSTVCYVGPRSPCSDQGQPHSPHPAKRGWEPEWPGVLHRVAMGTECRFPPIAFLFARHCNTSYVVGGAGWEGVTPGACLHLNHSGKLGGRGWE